MNEFELDFFGEQQGARLKVIGVGGGGSNAVNAMVQSGMKGVDFIVANTDAQALLNSPAPIKLQLGAQLTKGLGAGADPKVGQAAAFEDAEGIAETLRGADMVFVTAGMGGGTGTGAAPVIARVAREQGALAVGVVTRPFNFEGKARRRRADEGIRMLAQEVDTLIVIRNQRLLALSEAGASMLDATKLADKVLFDAVCGISELITNHGMINVDFADVRTIMSMQGMALMGTGRASGERRALIAAQQAISSPLLDDVSIEGARGILINFTGGHDLKISEIEEAASMVEEAADEDVNLIFGTVIDETMTDEIMITVIATGFEDAEQPSVDTRLAPQAAMPGFQQSQAYHQQPDPRYAAMPPLPTPMQSHGMGNRDPQGMPGQMPRHEAPSYSHGRPPMPSHDVRMPHGVSIQNRAHNTVSQPPPVPHPGEPLQHAGPSQMPPRNLATQEMGMPPIHVPTRTHQQAGAHGPQRPVHTPPQGSPQQSGEWPMGFTETSSSMEAMSTGVAERVRRIIPPAGGSEPSVAPTPSAAPSPARRSAPRTRSGPIQTSRRVTGSFSTPPRTPSISRIRRPIDEEELRRPAITRNSGSRQVGEDPMGPDFFDTGCIDASCDESIEIEASSVPAWLQIRRR